MILDRTQFSFIPPLEAGFETIRNEMRGLDAALFEPWPDTGAYLGDWLGVPLFMFSHPADVDRVFERNQRACPETMAILRGIPSVLAAGFSLMCPGCHILPHVDVKPPDVLRTHLGLAVPPGARLRVADEYHEWREGRCLIFDGTIDHETVNAGSEPRILLLVDARLDANELAYLRSTTAARD